MVLSWRYLYVIKVEKNVGKAENAGKWHFLLSAIMFLKGLFLRKIKSQNCVVKSQNIMFCEGKERNYVNSFSCWKTVRVQNTFYLLPYCLSLQFNPLQHNPEFNDSENSIAWIVFYIVFNIISVILSWQVHL